MKDVLYTLYVGMFISACHRDFILHPLFQHDFARKKRRNGLTGVFRFALHSGQKVSIRNRCSTSAHTRDPEFEKAVKKSWS